MASSPHLERDPVQVFVSFSDNMRDPQQRRSEVGFSERLLDRFEGAGVPSVRLSKHSPEIPAVVALRTELVGRRHNAEQWRLIIDPFDDSLHKRLFDVAAGEGPRTIIDGLPRQSASYDAMEVLIHAHKLIRLIRPAPVGTMIRIWVGFDRHGEVYVQYEIDSLKGLKREARRARETNESRKDAAATFWFGYRVWQRRWDAVAVPDIPKADEWYTLNRERLQQLITETFTPVLESLWRAAFATGYPAKQLKRVLPMEEIGQTIVTGKSLRALLERSDVSSARTMFDSDPSRRRS